LTTELSGCQKAGEVSLEPGVAGTFRDALPAALQAGTPRLMTYFVELRNTKGRSAGLSNGATVLAGTAPGEVAGLKAELRPEGVALHWSGTGTGAGTSAIRLHRRLLTPQARKPAEKGALTPAPELVLQDLLVDPPASGQTTALGAVDTTARVGETYEYTAQRVEQVKIDGKTIELSGPLSAAVKIERVDIFPPAAPSSLAAVFVAADANGQQKGAQAGSIDLSWQPNVETDLAGYVVYRAEDGGAWKRVSPAQPVTSPDWRDMSVEAGHSYRYAVSAVDLTGHESKRSEEATESVPQP
jgi:hypothetical protein